jgi:UDP-glucose 4-epimerase
MNDCTVLVVGGAEYIGTHMVNELIKAKIGAITLDNLSTGHRDLHPGGLLIEGRLGDAALLDGIFSTHDIAAVMYFAAYSLVGESETARGIPFGR